jgi:hypothetical protein
MNGIITLSDGAGVTIEGGVITAPTLDLQNLNTDEIQGTAPTNNISLYTDTTIAQVTLGAPTTAIVNVQANDTNILAGSSVYINSGTTTSVLASTINLISNEVIIGGGQDIQQQNTSGNFTIGGNVTARNFFLGNLVAPPQVAYAATTGFDVVNYDTCVALIGGGGVPTLYADDIYTFTSPSTFVSLWTDCTAGILIGNNTIANTCSVAAGCNNGSLALATISNRSADTFIATGQNHSGNVYIHSGQNSSGNVYIACNNYTGLSGSSTTGVYIGGASTSTAFNGQINIAGYAPASGTNSMIIGSTSTNMLIRCASLNIANSTPSSAPVNICSGDAYSGTLNICNGFAQTSTCNIGGRATTGGNNFITIGNNNTTLNLCTTTGVGGTQTILYGQAQTTHTHTGTQINLNSGNGTANTVSVGSLATTTLTDVAQTINVNSTNGNSNTINIGSSTSTINSWPIKPASGITYNASNGTNISGTIGYVVNQAVTPTTTLTFSGTGANRVAGITCGNMTLPFGVWMVSANIILRSLSTSSNLCSIEMALAPNICNNAFLNNFSTGTINVANYEIPINGCGIFTSVSGANVANFTISVRASTGSWAIISNIGKTWFKAVRIA